MGVIYYINMGSGKTLLHMSKCHIVGNHMLQLILFENRKRKVLLLEHLQFIYIPVVSEHHLDNLLQNLGT